MPRRTVLIVEESADFADTWGDALRPEIRVIKVGNELDALQAIDEAADILIAGQGASNLVLSRWINKCGGPAMVIRSDLGKDHQAEFFALGVFNVFRHIEPGTLKSLILRYTEIIETRETLSNLQNVIKRLEAELIRQRRMRTYLLVALAAIGGPEALRLVGIF